MKKIATFFTISILSSFLIYCPAMAHVAVSPSEIGVAERKIFTVSTPNESEVSFVKIRLVIPEGVTDVMPLVKTGWTAELKKNDSGDVTEIDWSGGEVPTEYTDQFMFSAKSPAKVGEINWKAYQTYSDGKEVAWDQKPTAESEADEENANAGPYSVTNVINDLTKKSETEKESSSNTSLSMAASLLALVLSAAALLKKKH